jgi:hypothetical protein
MQEGWIKIKQLTFPSAKLGKDDVMPCSLLQGEFIYKLYNSISLLSNFAVTVWDKKR